MSGCQLGEHARGANGSRDYLIEEELGSKPGLTIQLHQVSGLIDDEMLGNGNRIQIQNTKRLGSFFLWAPS